jgi:hypothetical protein
MKLSNQITKLLVLVLTVAIAGIAVVLTILASSTVFANHEFATNMTGQEEVLPP